MRQCQDYYNAPPNMGNVLVSRPDMQVLKLAEGFIYFLPSFFLLVVVGFATILYLTTRPGKDRFLHTHGTGLVQGGHGLAGAKSDWSSSSVLDMEPDSFRTSAFVVK